jgi:hypothetical protein
VTQAPLSHHGADQLPLLPESQLVFHLFSSWLWLIKSVLTKDELEQLLAVGRSDVPDDPGLGCVDNNKVTILVQALVKISRTEMQHQQTAARLSMVRSWFCSTRVGWLQSWTQ